MLNRMDLNVPKPFSPNKNQVAKDWQIWKKEFLTYLKLSKGYEMLSEERRAYLLQNLMGTKAFEAMENINFDNPQDKNDMDILLAKFDEVFDPPSNIVEDRFKFFSRMKHENETIENYVMNLQEIAKKCKFGDQVEKFIIDMIICNMDTYLRQMTFKEKEINLVSIIESYKNYMLNTNKIKELSENMNKVFNYKSKDDKDDTCNLIGNRETPKKCWKCNTCHPYKMCPAFGKVCSICNGNNHFDHLCRKKFHNNNEQPRHTCLKCNKNHPYRDCPAYYNICGKCKQKGHYESQCKKVNAIQNVKTAINHQNNNITSELPKEPSQSYTKVIANDLMNNAQSNIHLDDCLWCGSKHLQGQCPHKLTCSYCSQFPHNICFNCKNNPHHDSCSYKFIVFPKTNPHITEYHRKVNPEHFKTETENFVKVKHSDVQKLTQFQPRRPRPLTENPPPKKCEEKTIKKKDDNCCIC